MSTALKSEEGISSSQTSLSSYPRKKRRLTVLSSQTGTVASRPLHLPKRRPYPIWLRLLMVSQWVSCGVAVMAVMAALGAYALTVNTNRRLTVATANLERLQEQQQQLTAASAVFKNHLAQTALTTLQSHALHPKDVIFLEVAETPETSPNTEMESKDSVSSQNQVFPQGY
ncbi:MAG: hypothetical protein F6K42_24250 [Leptolyngbya sp. SIO1D8]|nr:hypothetical protein [Leptolyngbya sp. SIO1D8]